jgi:hypothetical protein
MALQMAGGQAAGSTLYVTLEPCSHVGRTGPCTEAILQAGVREVHVALTDPNPLVNGSGLQALAERGVRVVEEPAEGAKELIEAHTVYTVKGRPFVALALGLSDELLAELQGSFDASISSSNQDMASLMSLNSDRSNASYLIRAGREWQSDTAIVELLRTGHVDKVLTAVDLPLPPDFDATNRRTEPYVIAYPVSDEG